MASTESRITSQGQVSVPASIRKKLGLTPGCKIEWCEQGESVLVRRGPGMPGPYEKTPPHA